MVPLGSHEFKKNTKKNFIFFNPLLTETFFSSYFEM